MALGSSYAISGPYGMVKIWDFDILRYALSKAGEIARITGVFPEAVEFSGYECLKALGRRPTGTVYQWLRGALSRSASTTYSTSYSEAALSRHMHFL